MNRGRHGCGQRGKVLIFLDDQVSVSQKERIPACLAERFRSRMERIQLVRLDTQNLVANEEPLRKDLRSKDLFCIAVHQIQTPLVQYMHRVMKPSQRKVLYN